MGLSSKQVISSDGLDWSQTLLAAQRLELQAKPPVGRRQQPQNPAQTEPLKCPRCESTDTKFCYYNNYNKSQPRHFCKTCKRHWTKGGTLRNVPVGGGRKNKRLKTSKTSARTTTSTTTTTNTITTISTNGNIINRINPQMVIQAQQPKQNVNHQTLISPASSVALLKQDSNNGVVLGSGLLSVSQNQGLNFPTYEANPSSISTSFQSPSVYNYSTETMEDSIITTTMPITSSTMTQPWQVPNTSYWNWDDLDTFVPTDLNIPWDDSELKP